MAGVTEAYLEPSQTSAMNLFCKNSERPLAVDYFPKKLINRCLTGSKYACTVTGSHGKISCGFDVKNTTHSFQKQSW